MHDTLYRGKRFRTLNVIDEGTREWLAIEVDTSLPSERVIRVLEQLKEERGLPQQNGFVEQFNGAMRREFLDTYLFESLSQVREMAW